MRRTLLVLLVVLGICAVGFAGVLFFGPQPRSSGYEWMDVEDDADGLRDGGMPVTTHKEYRWARRRYFGLTPREESGIVLGLGTLLLLGAWMLKRRTREAA